MGNPLNMPRRTLAVITLASAVGISLSGCGSNDSGQEQAGADQSAAGQASSAPATGDAASSTAGQARVKPQTPMNVRQLQPSQLDQSASELPPIRTEPRVLDFGFITPSTDVTGTVKLINTSDTPLKILAVQPTCKCTTLTDLAGSEIPPGGSVDLEAVLEGGPNPSTKTASVKVLVENYPRPLEVELKAEVTLPIRVIPPHINAVRGQNVTGRIVIESITGEPFTICSIHGKVPTLMNFDPATDEPRDKYIYSYDLNNIEQPYPRYLVVTTDQPDTPVVDIYLRHETTVPEINRNLRVSGGFRHPFGRVDQGGATEMEIGFVDLADPIATVVSTSPDLRVDITGNRIEETKDGIITYQKMTVTPAADYTGVLYVPLTFMTASGQTLDVPIYGVVQPEGMICVPATADASSEGGPQGGGEPAAG